MTRTSRATWNASEDARLCSAAIILGAKKGCDALFVRIAIDFFDGRKSAKDVQYRYEVILKCGTKKTPWTEEEDTKLCRLVTISSNDIDMDWDVIASGIEHRNAFSCETRYKKVQEKEKSVGENTYENEFNEKENEKENNLKELKKDKKKQGSWSYMEDMYLQQAVLLCGTQWNNIVHILPFTTTQSTCKEQWKLTKERSN